MVDPNRKINRLSDDDAAFLRECEQEFRNRFTDDDNEYTQFCANGARPPPVVEPWQVNRRQNYGHRGGGGGGGGHRGGGGGNNHWRNNYRNRGRYQSNNYNGRPYNDRRHDGNDRNGGDRGGPSSYRQRPY